MSTTALSAEGAIVFTSALHRTKAITKSAPPVEVFSSFAPSGKLVPPTLEALDRGGICSIAGIHLSDVPALNYDCHLYQERELRSVTSNTRDDARALFVEASTAGVPLVAITADRPPELHDCGANQTIDQTRLFTDQVYDVYRGFPESQSIFQIMSPTGGFGGMVTKPWSERKKTAQQLLVESAGPLKKIPGIRVIPLTPPPLPEDAVEG